MGISQILLQVWFFWCLGDPFDLQTKKQVKGIVSLLQIPRFISHSPVKIGIMQMESDDKQTYVRDLVPTPTNDKLAVQVAKAIAV